MITIVQAVSAVELQDTRVLFAEYFEFLRREVETLVDDPNYIFPMTGFMEELSTLPGWYAPPDGRLLVAYDEGSSAGCVAFHKLGEGICEVKRLWARPEFRRKKIGWLLMEKLIAEARTAGYTTMVLSTIDILKEAIALYTTLGFEMTEAYSGLPIDHEVFMKLDLSN